MKPNESKSNRNLTNQNETKSNRNVTNQNLTNQNQRKRIYNSIQNVPLQHTIQCNKYHYPNGEKTNEPIETESSETKEKQTQYNTIIITLHCITLHYNA